MSIAKYPFIFFEQKNLFKKDADSGPNLNSNTFYSKDDELSSLCLFVPAVSISSIFTLLVVHNKIIDI